MKILSPIESFNAQKRWTGQSFYTFHFGKFQELMNFFSLKFKPEMIGWFRDWNETAEKYPAHAVYEHRSSGCVIRWFFGNDDTFQIEWTKDGKFTGIETERPTTMEEFVILYNRTRRISNLPELEAEDYVMEHV